MGLAAALLIAGCRGADVSQPLAQIDGSPKFDRLLSLPAASEYSGTIKPGQFIVCTSRSSPPSTYVYNVEVVDALPSDRHVSVLAMTNGTCAVVFQTNRRGGPVPVIRVTPADMIDLTGADLWDRRSLAEGFLPGLGYASIGVSWSVGSGFELMGVEGALVKFFYYPAIPSGGVTVTCPQAAGEVSPAVCESGNHGGTGTLNFELD